ncbi:plant UBX domain-containing protein 7-like [Panicum virgatum]|uniref:UBX domain-containing protein n=1 Tax=Panicum virgatum TaxID=38727 RepID=A0A8T0XSQ9_PANVG|nr:plant UBX domain-containing protein 7-like [Panicum virgatum]KAG2660164.1 hypothetical protein PVAP13_1KG409900 [Panicum virgatum]
MDRQMVSTFMEVTSCESQAYAVQHLGSCRWNLDEAINLYFSTGGGADPSGAPAPILPEEEVVMEEDNDDDYGVGVGGENGDGTGSTVQDDPSFGEAPYPAPVRVEATGWGNAEPGEREIEPTGWGEAEPGDGGEENVYGGQVPDDAEREDGCNNEDEGGGSNEDDNDQHSNMSYSDNEMNDDDDYWTGMDEDDSYYDASLAEDDGAEGGGEPPRRQPQSSLAEMYQLPFDLMCGGSFHDAKVRAAREDQFLLVNLQTRSGAGDFQSQLHNRDLWSDERVKNVVRGGFVFFLVQKRSSYLHQDECAKVSSFYKLEDDQLPAVLVLDPITGQLLGRRSGAMTPDEFIEYVDGYTKSKPSTMSMPKFVKRTFAPTEISAPAAAAVEQEPAAPEISAPAGASCSEEEPPAPVAETEAPAEMAAADDDEPMEGEKMCKLRIRLPDGTTVAKEFGCRRRVASLFAFCRSAVHGRGGGGEAAAEQQRAFRIMRFARGGFEAVQGGGGVTFEDLRLNNAAVSVVFDA